MVWLGMMLTMILAQSVQWWSEWGFRFTVVSSLGANLVVGILSGTRRRRLAHGWWWRLVDVVAVFILWLAYQVVVAATTSAIGSLSLCGSDASEEEKLVVAFWAPFLLLHLGGPDNLTAYALEDNKISSRQWLEIITKIGGVIYTIYNYYKNTHPGGRGALLLAASVVMVIAGAVRYWERANALRKANLDSMQEDASSSSKDEDKMALQKLKCRIMRTKRQGRWLRDGEALLLAQDLFPIWRHALVDSSVDPDSETQKASEMILLSERDWDWECMCKVAEMELSLIYDFLYTKAILAHTWCYYLIRLLSPLFTAAAAFLFCFWLLDPESDKKQQQQQQGDDGHRVRGSFVRITYALLAVTFLMDVTWLLRALGSTWAYAYLREQAPAWLHAVGRRRWCSLHRLVVRLDPLQLFCRDPVGHRRWSGTIGRYNLLDECTTTRRSQCPGWLASMAGDRFKEIRYLSKLPECVKKVLFERVTMIILKEAINKDKDNKKDKNMYTRVDIRTQWGQKTLSRAADEGKIELTPSEEQETTKFGEEFEEDVLLWHVATCMLLPHISIGQKGEHKWAIEVMSEYMMFLVAVRRQMLPGLVLHSQLQVTREKLVEIWNGGERSKKLPTEELMMYKKDKEKLAMLLRRVRTDKPTSPEEWRLIDDIKGTEGTRLLALAVDLYFSLSGDKRPGVENSAARWTPPRVPDEMLEMIFNVWVDKLVYAAVRCSREAHAKQLSAGGDLTTVLWMLIQHAGPFCMGEAKDIYIIGHRPKYKPEEPKPQPKPEEPKAKPKPKPRPKLEEPAPPRPPVPAPAPQVPPGARPAWPVPAPPPPSFPCPVCPPYYPPVCPPYYPSWPPVCPWFPQCSPQHEKPGDEPGEAREDEHEDSSSDKDSEE